MQELIGVLYSLGLVIGFESRQLALVVVFGYFDVTLTSKWRFYTPNLSLYIVKCLKGIIKFSLLLWYMVVQKNTCAIDSFLLLAT